MSTDPVIIALENAISVADSVELRLALGKHLLNKNNPEKALLQFEEAIRLSPGNLEAMEEAIKAAKASNNTEKLNIYTLTRNALSASQNAPKPTQDPKQESTQESKPQQKLHAQSGIQHLRIVDEDEDQTQPSITFEDVGGMNDLKKRLHRSFLLPLKNPALFSRFGKQIKGGLLLYGPPGCGKTFIARALAGEIGARFINIGISDVLDMWLGESERKLHELFENARRVSPTVLFFDEVDALGQRRTQLKGSAGRNIVNQLLSELDGIGNVNDQLFVLGATNQPWDVDPALRRPGRFDRMIFVPPPNQKARAHILQLKISDRPHQSIDTQSFAKKTEQYSGADLEALIDTATEFAIEKTLETGQEYPIDTNLMTKALKDIRPSTRPWLETARNYVLYANEGGVYDDLHEYLRSVGLG